MKTFTEEDLIAYHLGELSRLRRWQLRRALESDAVLAAESEAVAETLRAFSADSAPAVDEAMVERTWQRVRPSLAVIASQGHRTRTLWMVGAGSALAGAVVVIALLLPFAHRVSPQGTGETANLQPATIHERATQLLDELKGKTTQARPYNNRPGPLMTLPDAVAEDPTLAAHLDTAERVLTEVSHSEGRLEPATQEQVHRLLLQNAVYHQSAEQRGDMSTAAVIDDLGRVLTSLDAEPQQGVRGEDAFRLQMSVGGVLLDLRILHHNDPAKNGQ